MFEYDIHSQRAAEELDKYNFTDLLRYCYENGYINPWDIADVMIAEHNELGVEDGEKVTFDKVMALSDGEKTTVGAPYIESATVTAHVIKSGKGKKVLVMTYKPKKNEKKKKGHRQPYTKVQIEKING